MNEYIREEIIIDGQTKRLNNSSLNCCGKMLILFMLLDIAFQAVSGLFLPKGVTAALCPLISFIITFYVVCGKETTGLTKGMFVAVKGDRTRIMGGMSDCMFYFAIITLGLGVIAAVFDLVEVDIFSEAIKVSVPLKGFDGVVYAIYMCILAPVMHEVIFRGVVIRSLEGRGKKTAVFVSAVLFALFHGTYITNLYAFAMGMVIGGIAVKTGSLITTLKMNIICSSFVYLTMFAVWKKFALLYIPLLVVFGFFAVMGLLRKILGMGCRRKVKEKIDFNVLGTLAVVGTVILMVAEDLMFLLA